MKKALKIAGITVTVVVALLIFLALFPLIFKEKFATLVKDAANKEMKTEMNFSGMNVSFFRHFPQLTVTLTDFSLKSSAPFSRDTLVKARDISFGVNLKSLFSGPVRITKVYLYKGRIEIRYNEKGSSNFDVLNPSPDSTAATDTAASESLSFQIDNIYFIQTDFIYSDASIPLKIVAHGINYRGISHLNEDILKLNSRVRIDSLDAFYDNRQYLKSKPVKANLITSINMNSLDMKFEKNDLLIKDIPFEFKGEFTFGKDRYSLFLSLFSQFGEEYLSGSLYLVGTKNLWLSAKADINMDLRNWTRGFGVEDYDLHGQFALKLNARGEYATGPEPNGDNGKQVILSIPDFQLTAKLKDGAIRFSQLPQAISGISLDLQASSKNQDYRSISLQLNNLNASFLNNRLKGFFRVNGLADLPVEGHLTTHINLADLPKVIPMDSTLLKGMLDVNLDLNGNYAPEKKQFPVVNLSLNLREGFVQTRYYPEPIEKINLKAIATNRTGAASDTRILVDPLLFTFHGNPFELHASLVNFENLAYDITAHGSVDVGKIYQLFAMKGMDLSGFVSMDLALKGIQSDALAGRYDKLQNSGRAELRDITLNTEYLPLPFTVRSGIFRFENDKIRFEEFKGRYGSSDISMNGQLTNAVGYFLASNQKLKGSFLLQSDSLDLDEFIAAGAEPADSGQLQSDTSALAGTLEPEIAGGVIILPKDLELKLQADVRKINFQKLELSDFTADVEIKQGLLLLKSMKLEVAGCRATMDATYGSIRPDRAFFELSVNARDFDVKRAYDEVELFRNLSSVAGKCEGIVSLDYKIKGQLDEGMNPIYPSIEGSGVITLQKVKVMGLKLFNQMSKKLGKDQMSDPSLTRVEIRTRIKSNVITLEKTRMKLVGFRFKVSGESNFDGDLNFKARLGLPPLGIVGIPIRITGTQDDPKIRYGRGNNDENVEVTEYFDDLTPEMKDLIQNTKEEDWLEEQDSIPGPK